MELFLFWGISLLEIKPALGNQLQGLSLFYLVSSAYLTSIKKRYLLLILVAM
jgi:hypothetical protein